MFIPDISGFDRTFINWCFRGFLGTKLIGFSSTILGRVTRACKGHRCARSHLQNTNTPTLRIMICKRQCRDAFLKERIEAANQRFLTPSGTKSVEVDALRCDAPDCGLTVPVWTGRCSCK
jgi:hypothetical protein